MNKERINDLVNILGDEFASLENTFVIKNNEQLCAYLDNPTEWFQNQLADRERYSRVLIREAGKQLKKLNAMTEKAYLLSYKQVAKDKVIITTKGIIAKDIPQSVKDEIKKLKDFNAEQITNLANQTLVEHARQVQIVNALSTTDNLYDVIKNQMKSGIDKGIKIMYSNGRQFSWKAYMEMRVRTDIQNEISNEQVEYGAQRGLIFYICDSYADCAKDHAHLQGKIYYNAKANIPIEIANWISQHNIMSMQDAMAEPNYLTTRPNCRHNFHVIPTSEAMGMSDKEILEKYNYSTGKYKGSNYEKLQKQRYNERMIRKYKLRKEADIEQAKALGDKAQTTITADNFLIRKWQKRNRDLIDSNSSLLKREYDRESAKVITQDLGVRYDYKFKDGQPISRK